MTKTHPGTMSAAIFNNTYCYATPRMSTSGFRPAQTRYHDFAETEQVAENYWLHSFLKRHDAENAYAMFHYLADSGVQMVARNGEEDRSLFPQIPLISGDLLQMNLGEALISRRSTRKFTGATLSLPQLTSLLRAGNGVSAHAKSTLENGEQVEFALRTHPSAGGLYPIDVYVAVQQVRELSKGIYRYFPKANTLGLVANAKAVDALLTMTTLDEKLINLSQANVIVLFVMQPWKTMRKYGDRGLRFVFQEVGAIAQNIHLAATALKIGSVDCASFYEQEVNQLLNLNGVLASLTHAIIIGV